MKLNSKLFDGIRIKSRHPVEEPRPDVQPCAWEGCDQPGIYRAPKGNRAVGQFHHFCLEHVRHYNTTYNFFEGMSADEMAANVNRSTQTDGRPSWGFGSKAGGAAPRMPKGKVRDPNDKTFADPLNVFARYRYRQGKSPQKERAKPLHEPDRRAFEALGFHGHAPAAEVKMAYKKLVKIHHPDANGGDKSSEDRLRAIIAAYTHLKTRGFVGK